MNAHIAVEGWRCTSTTSQVELAGGADSAGGGRTPVPSDTPLESRQNVPFNVRWDTLTGRYLVSIPNFKGAMVVSIDGAEQQWRACASDEGREPEYSEWLSSLADAENELDGFADAEPAFDLLWVETRWCSPPVDAAEAERAGV